MTLLIHIGLHKTGTSSIQHFLKTNRAALAERGFAIPEAGWVQGGHHNLGYELLGKGRFDPAAGVLEAAIAEADGAPNAILTSEEFEFLPAAAVRRLREAVGEREARIIVYLRRQDALIASTFAQQIKMGAKLGPFDDYAHACLYEPRFDFSQLVRRWAGHFGDEALSVAVVSEETAGERLFADFASRAGFAMDGLKTGKQLNVSPTWSEVEVMRRAVARIKRGGVKLDTAQVNRIRTASYDQVAADPKLQSGRVGLPPELFERAGGRFEHGNAWVAEHFVTSGVQRDALTFGEAPAEAPKLPAQRLLAEAVDRIVEAWTSGALTADAERAKPKPKRKAKA